MAPESVSDWMKTVEVSAAGLLATEVDSWFTGTNANVYGKQNLAITLRISHSIPCIL